MIAEQIARAFPHSTANGCLTTHTDAALFVRDEESRAMAYLVPEAADAHFTLVNPAEKAIGFWRIDGCLIQTNETQRCDFSAFDSSTIIFVDIKDVRKSVRARARKDAYEQLTATLQYLLERLDLSSCKIVGIIGLTSSGDYPAAATRMQAERAIFEQAFGADLREGNAYVFE